MYWCSDVASNQPGRAKCVYMGSNLYLYHCCVHTGCTADITEDVLGGSAAADDGDAMQQDVLDQDAPDQGEWLIAVAMR